MSMGPSPGLRPNGDDNRRGHRPGWAPWDRTYPPPRNPAYNPCTAARGRDRMATGPVRERRAAPRRVFPEEPGPACPKRVPRGPLRALCRMLRGCISRGTSPNRGPEGRREDEAGRDNAARGAFEAPFLSVLRGASEAPRSLPQREGWLKAKTPRGRPAGAVARVLRCDRTVANRQAGRKDFSTICRQIKRARGCPMGWLRYPAAPPRYGGPALERKIGFGLSARR